MRVTLTYLSGEKFETDMKTLMVIYKSFDKEALLSHLDHLLAIGILSEYQTFNRVR